MCADCDGKKFCHVCGGSGKCAFCEGKSYITKYAFKINPERLTIKTGYLIGPLTNYPAEVAAKEIVPLTANPTFGFLKNVQDRRATLQKKEYELPAVDLVCVADSDTYHSLAAMLFTEEK